MGFRSIWKSVAIHVLAGRTLVELELEFGRAVVVSALHSKVDLCFVGREIALCEVVLGRSRGARPYVPRGRCGPRSSGSAVEYAAPAIAKGIVYLAAGEEDVLVQAADAVDDADAIPIAHTPCRACRDAIGLGGAGRVNASGNGVHETWRIIIGARILDP